MNDQPNLNYIDELAEGDVAFREKFIGIIKTEFPLEREEYMDHLKNQRFKETAMVVHKMKHKFNILSMQEAYGFAVRYEEELLKGHSSMDSSFKAILQVVDTYIESI